MTVIRNQIAIAIPIHAPHYQFASLWVYASMGGDFDLVFVHTTDAERLAFEQCFSEPALEKFQSLVLADHFSDQQLAVLAQKRAHPSVKKFYALARLKTQYSHVICLDAECLLLRRTGWAHAAQTIMARKQWFGGQLHPGMVGERQIVQCSMTELPRPYGLAPDYFDRIDELLYTWWWDLPVYETAHISAFLDWIGWHDKDHFLRRITWFSFDHVVYQYFTHVYHGFEFVTVVGHYHSLEFSPTNVVQYMHTEVSPLHWVNALAYAQNPVFYQERGFLAVFHLDRSVYPNFNIL
jgi:hypothetical protein